MIRKIVNIDKEKCNGCAICITACHEGALELVDGKATLVSDIYCDGLGDCLPGCPMDAINIIERSAEEYDDDAVQERIKSKNEKKNRSMDIMDFTPFGMASHNSNKNKSTKENEKSEENEVSALKQWPCQIKLVQPTAGFFRDAELLIAADCTAYAYRDMHSLMEGKVTLIGCPKLDEGDYSEKLALILEKNNIKSLKLVRMEVPCCGGLEVAIKNAMLKSGKVIPWEVVVISRDGRIL